MTPEKITQKIMDTLLDKETKDTLANRVYFIIQEAQREAVEKTKRACWEWLARHAMPSCRQSANEFIDLDVCFSKGRFNKELTTEKVLGEG